MAYADLTPEQQQLIDREIIERFQSGAEQAKSGIKGRDYMIIRHMARLRWHFNEHQTLEGAESLSGPYGKAMSDFITQQRKELAKVSSLKQLEAQHLAHVEENKLLNRVQGFVGTWSTNILSAARAEMERKQEAIGTLAREARKSIADVTAEYRQ